MYSVRSIIPNIKSVVHNRPSAALLTLFGFGPIPEYAPFSLSLSALHLSYSYKPMRVFQNQENFETPSYCGDEAISRSSIKLLGVISVQ